MSNPRKIKEIFVELKASIGDLESDRDLLRLASELVLTYKKQTQKGPVASIAEYRKDFASMDLVTAMSDGGWRIMEEETELMREHFGHVGECENDVYPRFEQLFGLAA